MRYSRKPNNLHDLALVLHSFSVALRIEGDRRATQAFGKGEGKGRGQEECIEGLFPPFPSTGVEKPLPYRNTCHERGDVLQSLADCYHVLYQSDKY